MNSTKATILSIDSIEEFRLSLLGKGRSEKTTLAYASDMRTFLVAVGEEKIPLEDLEELAMSWLNLTRTKAAPKTTTRRITSLKAYAKWAGMGGILQGYIAPKPGRPVPHPIPEGLSGVQRMLDVCRTREQSALVGLCALVGLRISEARLIQTSNFDVVEMTLKVWGKGDRIRIVPISERAWWTVSSAYVVGMSHPDERLISYSDRAARKAITRLGELARLSRPVSSHDLRATFATVAFQSNKDLRVVQELLGHATSTQTEIYTGISMARMREAVEF